MTPTAPSRPHRGATRRVTTFLMHAALACLALLFVATPPWAQDQAGAEAPRPVVLFEPIRTESPRETLETFRRLTDSLEQSLLDYVSEPSLAGMAELVLLSDQFISLLDLTSVAAAARRETGVRTYSILIDIFGRVGLPDPATVPDLEEIEASGSDDFRIPQTPLRLIRIAEGEREGEFLFSGAAVQIAPRFLGTIQELPLNTRLDTDSVTLFGKQLTGPLIPSGILQAMPPALKTLWLDTPKWKVLMLGAVGLLGLALLVGVSRVIRALPQRDRVRAILMRLLLPIAVIVVVTRLVPFLSAQINLSGRFANMVATGQTVLAYLALAWIVWLAVRLVVEMIIRSPRISDEGFDAGILRLGSIMVGIIAVSVVLVYGGQEIGLPVMSIVAGLGIGGIAVALAVRPTLENLIGGVILYVDRPVGVGDFCSFGDQTGTVEEIGIRSTKLRALDRTLISVPNAQFADMQIVNWAKCDEMLVNTSIGLRYETRPDQLRYLLSEIRRMLHAHPRINANTVRVRFGGFGQSDLQVALRFYVMTREWNDFFAVREDVYFRLFDLIEHSGTGLAYPSQTLYLARDGGVNAEKGALAEEAVAKWRRAGQFPFPRLTPDEIERLRATLDYPERSSPDAGSDAASEMTLTDAEPLSAPTSIEHGREQATTEDGDNRKRRES